ncbi:MAG: peptide ABC transporter permease [Thaumarchaeota archaeon 13_1_40CM_2_39_13_2]|nr:MAG: peptide ABC transporter permease [Thaumarchaeota archaeon 13_1_40CM_2_39_13_2]OLE41031.1 MAG: peptide ABC transporter permease [Thaumarchaeota archaeon 13_1_20CM_2_39_20]
MSFSPREIRDEFLKNNIGLIGIGILGALFGLSIIAFVTIPAESLRQWNDPASWLAYPKSAMPAWINYFLPQKIPEHLVLLPQASTQKSGDIISVTNLFAVDYQYDSFPSDFIYQYGAKYSGSPLIFMSVARPDGMVLQLISTSLPSARTEAKFTGMIFSTDDSMKKNLKNNSGKFSFSLDTLSSGDIVFSKLDQNKILKGHYIFKVTIYNVGGNLSLDESKFILGGKVYGLMGTDELRRDLAVGLLWGTPLALFIGITVSVGSVILGLVYGVFAGYKGKKTDETMMRLNDIVYAMPVLPLLIILAVTVGNSIFLIVGFLVIFGWVGIAKVSRSMALQIKELQYVEASKLMGQKGWKIIFKHIIPQLLPYTFASIAISVPGAIITEAGLSFLGLGDPTFPTWGQILHDASSYGAAERGLWWWIIPPGIMIAITGLAFVFMGHAMDTIVNPKLRR